ncbi:MAG: branched-chain amino acid ABC transporter permease [Betaproteobacteria bacterium]|jgi:branched-chain amino acid transport system permease protein|nr:branched-chain amino acid ABC transporter permease [Betaproteobacteria bacterium]
MLESNRMPTFHVEKMTWFSFALVLLIAPWLFTSNLSMTMMSQMGIAIIACLSYNVLLGQGGMLSFGHAVYSGMGSYLTIHALNAVGSHTLHLPVSLLPLIGGLAGMGFAVLLGFVTTRKSGTTFSMITLGMAELVFAMSLMFSEFFGGEAGVSANRVAGQAFMGITYGPQRQVYYLIAVYTFISVGLLYALTQTPLGRILNAVRDNPERVEFVGYNTQMVRYRAFIIAGFFAGIAGGLGALNFEIVTAEVVGPARSGAYLLFTFLGGATFFFGPVLGGVLMVLAFVLLSELTKAWLLYLGLIFLLMVVYAPGGFAALIMINLRVIKAGAFRRLYGVYAGLLVAGSVMFAGASSLIEMIYHLQLNSSIDTHLVFAGLRLDTHSTTDWVGTVAVMVIGLVWFDWQRKRFINRWESVQSDMTQAAQAGGAT